MRAPARSSSCCRSPASCPGFVSLQPMDRDEPRYAQASKQMLESGDFVDIRFQNEARHKKPVGIYWLQAASVAAGEALGVPDAHTAIALYRIPSLIGATAMVLLTYWAALAFGGRREAFLAAAFVAASRDRDGRGAARQDRRRARRLLGRRHGRARPRLFRARRGTASALDGADLLACGRGRRAGQGPARADVRRACRAGAVCPRALGALVPGAAARSRRAHRAGAGAAVVRRHRGEERRRVLHRVGRARHARQGRHGADLSLAAAGLLRPRVLRDLLAGGGACRPRDPVRVEEPERRPDRLRARLDRAELARLRARADEAAALRHAALSGDRDRHRAGAVARFRRAARPRLEADRAADAVHPGRDRGRACLRGQDPRRAPALGRACRHASRHARCLRGLVALRPRRARRRRRSSPSRPRRSSPSACSASPSR